MTKSFSKSRIAHLALLGVAIIYGCNYIIARDVMVGGYMDPNAFIFIRAFFAVVIFFSIHRQAVQFTRKEHIRMFFGGLTGIAINQLFFFNGLKLTGPIQASLIMITTPIIVYILSVIFLKNLLRTLKIAGVVCGVVGAFMIIYRGEISGDFINPVLGNVFIFVNASSYAIYLIIIKPLMTKHPPLIVMKYVFFYGLLIVIPFSMNQVVDTQWQALGSREFVQIAYVVIFTTYLAYRFNAFALKYVSPVLVSMYLYLQPVVATSLSVMLGIEFITVEKVIAAALIVFGILLVSLRPSKTPSKG